jgi:hypothetical protein
MLPLALVLTVIPLRLESIDSQLFLVDGKHRLNLTNWGRRELQFSSGSRLIFSESASRGDETIVVVGSKKVVLDFSKQIGVWIADESLWGRKGSNDLRYTNSRIAGNRGISGDIGEAISSDGKTALCILNLRMAFASAVPVIQQLLVRFDPTTPEEPKLLQILPGETGAGEMGSVATKRFFKWGGKTFIWMDTRFASLDASGQLGKDYILAPPGAPLQYIGQRYVLLYNAVGVDGYDIFDLKKRKSFAILRGVPGTDVFTTAPLETSWLRAYESKGGVSKSYLVRVPDGKRAKPPADTHLVWRDYAVHFEGNTVKVYSILSGKLVADLRAPKT